LSEGEGIEAESDDGACSVGEWLLAAVEAI
jgi:hypothetical protein